MRHSVIHIGANKTASTTLQRALFSTHSQIQYLGEDGVGYADYAPLVNSLANDDDLYYPANKCAELFQRHLSEASDKTFLYSNEDVMTSHLPLICAKRLHSLVPDAEILLVIRNQHTAVPSFYANHGAFLKPAPPSYFRRHVSVDDWISFQTMFDKYGALASFRYDQFLSIYEQLFGKDRVHVLLFEEFVSDRKSFIDKLSGILRIDPVEALNGLKASHERRRLTGRLLAYNKFRTSFFWGTQFSKLLPFGNRLSNLVDGFLEKGSPAKIAMSPEIKKTIHELYCEGNTKLAEKYNLPLAQYGYPLSAVPA